MKRFTPVLGSFLLPLLVAACSSDVAEGPPPFALSLEGQLEAEFGAKFTVDSAAGQAFIASPLSRTRVVGTNHADALAAAKQLFTAHAAPFGAAQSVPALKEVGDATETTSIHLAQLIPGTEIEILGKGAQLDLDSDGTMLEAVGSFLDAPKLERPVTTTASDVEKKVSALAAKWNLPEASPPEIVDKPRLVATPTPTGIEIAGSTTFKIDLQGFEAKFDAYTLETLEVTRPQAGIAGVAAPPSLAKGVFSYELAHLIDPMAKRDLLRIETTVNNGTYYLVRNGSAATSEVATKECTGLSSKDRMPKSEDISSATADEFLGKFPLSGFHVNAVGLLGPGIAVNLHHNTLELDKHFRALFGESPSRDNKLVGLIHANDTFTFRSDGSAIYEPDSGRFTPSWDPVTNLVSFGDGGYLAPKSLWIKPPAVALDVVAHEWTHAYVHRKAGLALVGEDGAMQEGIADAIGAFVAARAGDKDFTGIGKHMRLDGAYIRNFANPQATNAPVLPAPDPDKPGAMRGQGPMPKHRAGMDKACAFRGPDGGCVHFNAGPLNHAFYLMLHGGSAIEMSPRSAAVGIRVVAGNVATIEKVWVHSASSATTIKPTEPVRGEISFMKIEAMALQQVNKARSLGDAKTLTAVGCAWLGTGFVTRQQLAARGVTCLSDDTERASGPSDCRGKPDGYHCNPTSPYSGTLCRGGGIAGGMQCRSGTVCARKSPDSTEARVTPEGAMLCEEHP